MQSEPTNAPQLDFVHRWAPGAGSDLTLLLLHGTGGNEDDLMPLGRKLAPGAALLGVRGKALENGMPRFFRRLAEGVFDQDDLRRRTDELAAFVVAAGEQYGFTSDSLVAVGYSNGANIAASMLLRHPGVLRRAVLFRAMVPFRPETPPELAGTAVLMSSGRRDPIVVGQQVEGLAAILRDAGAEVALQWQDAGHELREGDVQAAQAWLAVRASRGGATPTAGPPSHPLRI